MRKFPILARLLPAAAAAALLVLLAALTRIAIAVRADAGVPEGLAGYFQIFARGLWFDLAAAIFAITPLVLWLALAPARLARTWLYRGITVAAFCGACFGLLVLAVAELLFWEEFGGRFNFIAVDYLLYTHEVLGNVWESYPVGRILVVLALGAAGVTALLARRVWQASGAPLGWRAALAVLLVHGLLFAGALRFADSDQKNFSALDGANELAGNGLFEFFAALRRNELSFERYYATLPLDEALALVRGSFEGAEWIEPGLGGVERHVRGRGAERKLNVVVVTVESLGAEFLGVYGNTQGLTPNLDRLSRESLWFSNVYATGNRTVRGLEAVALALPPTPGQSIVRRPNNDALFSLGSVFEDKGYGVLFAYGGYGYFDNMNAFFDANDYRSVDRRAIPASRIEFENIWGVADENLFDQVLEEFDRDFGEHPGRPLFAHVMTTSNHRPYTYPAGRIDIPSGTGRGGAVKYTDYALGRFLDRARAKPWFKDTVFVITADHGANARGGAQIPVVNYRIPLFVYAPGHVAPGRIDRLMSQIDIAPTLLGLLDFDYYSKFLGRDLLHSPPESDRAFVANYQTLGYLKGEQMIVLQPKRTTQFRSLLGEALAAGETGDPQLVREAIAFYQVASHVFRNGLYRDEEQVPPTKRVTGGAGERRAPSHPLR